MTRPIVRAATGAMLWFLSAASAVGQPVPPTPAALLRTSDVALTGVVTQARIAEDHGTLSRFVAVAVDEVYKGWIPERDILIIQSDAALAFRVGESVLLFLEILPDRTLAPAATWGKWIVTRDPITGARIARPEAAGARIAPFGRPAIGFPLAALPSGTVQASSTLLAMSRVPIDVRPRIAIAAVAAALDETVPGPPQQLTASVGNAGGTAVVDLFWLPPATGGAPASYRVDAGSASGLTDIASVAVAANSLHATVSLGFAAFVRVFAVNAAGVSTASNEVRVVAAVAPPGAPTALDGSIAHGLAKLMWVAPSAGRPVSYVVEAGSSSGATDIGRFETNSPDTFASGFLAPRLYFFRVRAKNSAGLGPPSNEISFAAPGSLNCMVPEAAPANVSAIVSGSTLTLNFTSLYPGGVTYVVQAGSTPGALDIATLDVGSFNPAVVGGVPPRQYYLRLFTRDFGCGIGSPSNEILVTIR